MILRDVRIDELDSFGAVGLSMPLRSGFFPLTSPYFGTLAEKLPYSFQIDGK